MLFKQSPSINYYIFNISWNLILKKIFLFISLFLFSLISHGQTKFSFSGLHWGDTIEQVEVKLKSSGFGLSQEFKDKVTCKLMSNCSLDFKGQVRGSTLFESGKLVEVLIFADNNTYSERAAKLKEKYGIPLQNTPVNTGAYANYIDSLNMRWRSDNGETLKIDSSGYIRYTSGAFNNIHEGNSNSVNF